MAVQRIAEFAQSGVRFAKSYPPTPGEGFELLRRQGISIESARESLMFALEFRITAKELPGETWRVE